MSRSGYHDRRGFEPILKGCVVMIVISLFVLFFYSWKIGVASILFFVYQFVSFEAFSAPPPNDPRAFENWSYKQEKRRPALLCLGDSLTHGKISANITTKIPMKLAAAVGLEAPTCDNTFNDPIWVINAGQNYLTSHVILHERLSKAMGTFPDYIVLLIGTNDVLSMYHPLLKKYVASMHGLSESQQTMAVFESNMNNIIKFIRESSPKVQLGVCTLPPIGEDLSSTSNQLIKEANAIIEKAVANAADERTSVIPIFTELESIIEKKRRHKVAPSFEVSMLAGQIMMYTYIWLSSSTGVTWNMLSKLLLGNVVTTEGIHLNETGRDIVVDLIVEWLKTQNFTKVLALKSF